MRKQPIPPTVIFNLFAFVISLSFLLWPLQMCAQQEDLKVFNRWINWSNPGNMLIQRLNHQAFSMLDQRANEVDLLQTAEHWKLRQQRVKKTLNEILGPWPEKTPLNARVTGTVNRPGYRIEKVIYESQPGFYVTGCLFIPDNIEGPSPAILNVIGHTGIAFRGEGYQRLIYNLVNKKFIVFAIDPVGQGERLQYFDPELGKSVVGGSTAEHSYVGRQCFLAGYSVARYFTWDGIRAVDYLLTRKEVDARRIGITGISGGGTQTSYIWAVDDRLAAAAPTCYITGFRRLLESIGPQDAEQNIFHGIAKGITHADFLEVQAPKPTLIAATTRDFFSIQGARETFKEVQRSYKALGNETDITLVEDDYGHGYTAKNREAIYSFFRKALHWPGNIEDEEVEILDPEVLQVTTTGQLATSLGGKTAFDLVKGEADKLVGKLALSRQKPKVHLEKVLREARRLSGYQEPPVVSEAVFRGNYPREGYRIEMWALEGECGITIPVLLFAPEIPGLHPALVYVNPEGKKAGADTDGELEKLVKAGFVVAAVDVSGVGELAGGSSRAEFTGVLIGRSVLGVQASDVVRVVRLLENRDDVAGNKIFAISVAESCPAVLHAAAFEQRIAGIALLGTPVSYASVATNRFYKLDFNACVPGALTAYDLADLVACVAPRRIVLAGVRDQMGEPLAKQAVLDEYLFSSSIYQQQNANGRFTIEPMASDNLAKQAVRWFLR
ncbi:alpha/beta hydrolase family protein [Gemmatimonadota bacterium]